MEQVKDRIKRLRKHFGLTQVELGKLAGVSKSAVSQWERGITEPERDALLSLQQTKKINPQWVSDGKEPMLLSDSIKRTIFVPSLNPQAGMSMFSVPAVAREPGPEFVAIERVNLKVSAGVTGFAVEHLDGNGSPIFFRADWLAVKGYRAERLYALKVDGDSMEPNLWDGDLVVINTDDAQPRDGDVFVVNYEGEPVIKRLEREAGEWWLASDNPRYKRKRCADQAILIGRVIYKQSERI